MLTRDEKVENLVTNFSLIMMGIFEGVFTALASGVVNAMSTAAETISGSNPVPRARDAEMDAKFREVFAGLRKEVSKGFAKKDEKFKAFIRDSAFDQGIKIVERHDVGLPKLTDHLTDTDLAGYVALIQKDDPNVARLMAELGEWQKTMPKFTQ